MAQQVSIDADGKVTVDGVVITPGEVDKVAADVDKAWKLLSNRRNWTFKNAEKVLAYAAALVSGTNVFGQIGIPSDARATIVGAAAFVLAAIHVSTPKTP